MSTEHSVDPSYEYNAPQFVDFDQLGSAPDENVEDYFNYDHEKGTPVVAETFDEDLYFTPQVKKTPNSASKNGKSPAARRNTPRSCRTTPKCAPKEQSAPKLAKENVIPPDQQTTNNAMGVLKKATESGMPAIKPVLANLCTDLNAWRSKPTINTVVTAPPRSQALQKPRRKSNRKSGLKAPEPQQPKRLSHDSPAMKRHRRSNSQAEPLQQRKHQRTLSKPRNHVRTASVEVKAKPQESLARTTRPRHRTSSVGCVPVKSRSRSTSRNPAPTTKNASFDHPTAAAKKNTSMDTGENKNKGKLTIPATPSFMKRKPLVAGEKQPLSTEQMELEKIKEMRRDLERKRKVAEESHKQAKVAHSYVPKHSILKPTQPHEFKFATDSRLKEHGMETRQDKDVKDFAMQLRHHSNQAEGQQQHKPMGPTKPQPFDFHDRKRKRTSEPEEKPNQFQSMAEKMIAFARKTPDRFRMKPKKNEMCHKSEDKPKLTVPKTPQLMSRKRSRPVAVKSQAEIEEEVAEQMKRYKFHAQPLNEEILKKQVGVKKVPSKELTKPVEVELETDRRLQYRHEHSKSVEQEAETSHSRSLRAKPFVGVPFVPKFDHKVTEPKPFSFDEKDRDRFSKKEEKIRQVVEEEKRMASEFRAQPIPDLSPVLPSRQQIPPTQPEPFHLASDNRGSQKAEEWNQRIKDELKQQRAAANFHARPSHTIHKKPFVPQKSTKPLTDLGDLELNTERRAEKRAEFEALKHEHELEAEETRRQQERMRDEEARREYERQRVAAVHRAQPVKKFKRVDVRPSDRPLTQPMTPRFSNRLRTRDHEEESL